MADALYSTLSDIVDCLKYISYSSRFGSWLCSRLLVVGYHHVTYFSKEVNYFNSFSTFGCCAVHRVRLQNPA
jgi:hypothetical protein